MKLSPLPPLLLSLLLSSCASAPMNVCQGAAGYAAAKALGYPAFLLVLGVTNNTCYAITRKKDGRGSQD